MKTRNLLNLAFAITATSAASAAIVPLTSLDQLGDYDRINWGSVGVAYDSIATPSTVTTVGGESVLITGYGPAQLRVQGTGGWSGDFEAGECVLWSQNHGALTFDPETLFQGAAFQIQSDYYGAYTAELKAYDSNGAFLGSVTAEGTSLGIGNGSAAFLAFSSEFVDVDKFVVCLIAAEGWLKSFAINDIAFSDAVPAFSTPVPEAKHAGLIGGLVLVGIGAWRRLQLRSMARQAQA